MSEPVSGRSELRLPMRTAALGAVLLAVACTAVPQLATPKATVAAVRLDRVTGTEARFAVLVALVNPNDRAIAVDAIEAELSLEAIAVGTARLGAPLRLPAGGEAQATLEVRAAWPEALRAFGTAARRARGEGGAIPGMRYAVTGTATVAGGATIPFSRAGEFALPPGAPPRP